MLKLQYIIRFIQAGTMKIVQVIAASHFRQLTSPTTCICYICILKLLLKVADVKSFVKQESRRKSDSHDLGVIHLDERTLFTFQQGSVKILVLCTDSDLINRLIGPFLLPPRSTLLITFGNHLQS